MERLRDIVHPPGPVLPIYENAGEGSSSRLRHASPGESIDQASSPTRGSPECVKSACEEPGIPLAEIQPHSIHFGEAHPTQSFPGTITSDASSPIAPSSQGLSRQERQSICHHETSTTQQHMNTEATTTTTGDGIVEDSINNKSAERLDQAAVVVPSTRTAAITPHSSSRGTTLSAVAIPTQTKPAQVRLERATTDSPVIESSAADPPTADFPTADFPTADFPTADFPTADFPTADRSIAESTARQQEAPLEAEQRSSTVPADEGATTTHDVGDAQNGPPVGYPRLAERMARMPAASIFRSFTALNIQNLLHMQAEIECLENELLEVQREDAGVEQNDHERRSIYTRNWWMLQRSGSKKLGSNEHDRSDQWRIAQKIQRKLQKYNEALIQLMTILSANKPDTYDFEDIRDYIESEEMLGGGALTGIDRVIYHAHPENNRMPLKNDLITLLPRVETDRFTRWVIRWVLKRLHKAGERTRRQQRPDAAFVDDKYYRWTFFVTSGLAAMLPVASMLALQSVEEVRVRPLSLGLIAIFNFVLAFLLTWLASVRRVDVFAIASAFAAVNVVFIAK